MMTPCQYPKPVTWLIRSLDSGISLKPMKGEPSIKNAYILKTEETLQFQNGAFQPIRALGRIYLRKEGENQELTKLSAENLEKLLAKVKAWILKHNAS